MFTQCPEIILQIYSLSGGQRPSFQLIVHFWGMGKNSQYAGRLILKAGDCWPLAWPNWYDTSHHGDLYWERIKRRCDEFSAIARIIARRRGAMAPGADEVTLPMPGVWIDATLYLTGLLTVCSDPLMGKSFDPS